MFKKLFTKYVATSMSVIIISYMFLACFLLLLTQRYIINEKERIMQANLEVTSGLARVILSNQVPKNMLSMYYSSIDLLAKASDSVITVVDRSGAAVYSTDFNILKFNAHVSEDIINKLETNKQFREVGTLGQLYNTNRFAIGSPLIGDNQNQIGAIFISSSASGYSVLIGNLMKLFLMSSILTLIFTFVLMFFLTRRLVKPLNEMSRAAKSYAKGNFDARISLTGVDEINELAYAFNNMADSLSHLENMRRSFLQNVSHDLRTPMTTISGFIDGMLDGTITPEQYPYYLSVVSDETKRLTRLTKTLLDISELESDAEEFAPESYDICESIRRALLTFESHIISKELKLKINLPEEEVYVYADKDAIHRVIYNLIDNAIKFSYNSGMLTITAKKDAKNAIISIRNTGVGISQEDLPFIFDRFFKSDKSRGLDKKGMGLGLYIAKAIVEKQGGTIRAESTENEFCEISFTLPLSVTADKGGKRHEQ